jgi:hypothetical protein
VAAGEDPGIELADVGPVIVATVGLPGCDPERALAAFTDLAVLARWWRGELTAPGLRVRAPVPVAAIGERFTDLVQTNHHNPDAQRHRIYEMLLG